jgi:serine/threonine protein phosphatase 1
MGREAQEGRILVAVGDVHGRADLLDSLLDEIETLYRDRALRYVFLGDYVDRGPDSKGVIERLIALRERRPDTVFLKGNHEQALLESARNPLQAEAWLSWGGREPLISYGVEPPPFDSPVPLGGRLLCAMPQSHLSFLRSLKLSHLEDGHLFVHAGLDPEKPLDEQDEQDLLWIRDRFRFGGEGAFPDLVVVHGHTPQDAPEDLPWRINVDTGAVWTSVLTAVCLEGGKRRFVSTGRKKWLSRGG